MGGSKKQTTGFKYYLGVHMAICHGPVDAIKRLFFDDRPYPASAEWDETVDASTSPSAASVSGGYGTKRKYVIAESLFGGESHEGGVAGYVDLLWGDSAQTQNSYLVSKIGSLIPSFRGVMSLVFSASPTMTSNTGRSGFLWSANNPYLKPVAVKVKRILNGWNTPVWYSAKAAIGQDMNPAHIIYQCLTDPVWGMSYPATAIGSSFTAAADALYTEGFGVSMIWNQQAKIGDFIREVLNHIGGVLYVNPATGQFEIRLFRADYVAGSLAVYDESNSQLESFQRVAYGETTNEITVVFRDSSTNRDSGVTVQDLANVQAQGAVVSQTKQYPGISNAALAQRVAMRDLVAMSTPLSRIRLTVNRKAWNLVPGDVFKLSWTKFGLTAVIYRVLSVNGGTLTDGKITVEAVEDVFGLPSSTYSAQEPGGWVDPSSPPADVTTFAVKEANYYELSQNLSQADIDALDGTEAFVFGMANQPATQNTGFRVYSSPDTVTANFAVQEGDGYITPSATLSAAITDPLATTCTYENENALVADSFIGKYAYVDNEIILVTAVNTGTKTLTISRGCIDTVPATHSPGARIWFWNGENGWLGTNTDFTTGELSYFRATGTSPSGETAIASAPQTSLTMASRWTLPYPPADVKIDGAYFPATIGGAFTLTWSGRNRLQETAGVVAWTDGHIAPEDGTTYRLRIYDADLNTLVFEQNGLLIGSSGGTYTFNGLQSGTADTYRIELVAVRDGLTSFAQFSHTADVVGYGLSYGNNYGGNSLGTIIYPGQVSLYGGTKDAYPIAYNGSSLVFWQYIAETGTAKASFFSSSDGQSWSYVAGSHPAAVESHPMGFAYGGGRYVWFNRYINATSTPYRAGMYYMTTSTSLAGPFTITTITNDSVSSRPMAIMWDGTRFLLFYTGGAVYSTTDGVSLSLYGTATGYPTYNDQYPHDMTIRKSGSNWIACFGQSVGGASGPMYSADGLAWSTASIVDASANPDWCRLIWVNDVQFYGGNAYCCGNAQVLNADGSITVRGFVARSTNGGATYTVVLQASEISVDSDHGFHAFAKTSSWLAVFGSMNSGRYGTSNLHYKSSGGTSWSSFSLTGGAYAYGKNLIDNGTRCTLRRYLVTGSELQSTTDFATFTTMTRT